MWVLAPLLFVAVMVGFCILGVCVDRRNFARDERAAMTWAEINAERARQREHAAPAPVEVEEGAA